MTGVIIAIVVVVIVVIAVVAFVMPRRRQQREIEERRERIAGEHRAEAELHEQRADLAERGETVDEPAPLRDEQPMHEPEDGRFTRDETPDRTETRS